MHSDGRGAGVSGRSTSSLRVIRGGRGAPDIGPIGDLGGTVNVATAYKDVAQHYADMAGGLPKEIIEDANKAIAVYEAVGEGAAIGGLVGPWGAAAGAVIAGIYATFDNFGGDIEKAMHDTFNPEDFTPGQYDEMKRNCVRSGGIPNWGHAPDNEDGCIYPDGTTSGGDYARHPPPGQQSIRGDSYYDYNAERGTCPGPFGVPMPLLAGTKCLPGIGPVPIAPAPKRAPVFSQFVKNPTRPLALLPTGVNAATALSLAQHRAAVKRLDLINHLAPGEKLPLKAERQYLSASDQAVLAAADPPAPVAAPTPADVVQAQAAVRAAAPTDAPAPSKVPVIVAASAGAVGLAGGLLFLVKRLL